MNRLFQDVIPNLEIEMKCNPVANSLKSGVKQRIGISLFAYNPSHIAMKFFRQGRG